MMPVIAEVVRLGGRFGDVRRRWGVKGVITRGSDKLYAYAACPFHRTRLRGRTFAYRGERLPYFAHHYNATWRSERAVEVPIALRFLRDHAGRRGLEVGNVLAYYAPVSHLVIDKYERVPGVVNADVLDFRPKYPVEFIISVSTLEHVGWDEEPHEPDKAINAIQRLRMLLTPGGRMLVTCPRGYNHRLDMAVADGSLKPVHETFLTRSARRGPWVAEPRARALGRRPYYSQGRHGAYDLWVAEFDSAR
jgi:hypothetical protein